MASAVRPAALPALPASQTCIIFHFLSPNSPLHTSGDGELILSKLGSFRSPTRCPGLNGPGTTLKGSMAEGFRSGSAMRRGAVWVPDSPCLPTLTSLSCEFLYHLAMTIAPTSQGRFGEFYFINMCKALGMVAGGLCSERPVLGFVFCLIIFEHGAPHTPVALGCVNPVASPGKSPVCVNTYNLAQSS